MSEVPAELRELLDERAIRRVLYDYCRGVDRRDAELIRSVYHPDAVDEHGGFVGLGVEFPEYVLDALENRFVAVSHQLTNCKIDLAGEEAFVETLFVAAHERRAELGGGIDWLLGRYLDRFERRDGEWKIARRLVVRDMDVHTGPDPAFGPGVLAADGQMSTADVSYLFARKTSDDER